MTLILTHKREFNFDGIQCRILQYDLKDDNDEMNHEPIWEIHLLSGKNQGKFAVTRTSECMRFSPCTNKDTHDNYQQRIQSSTFLEKAELNLFLNKVFDYGIQNMEKL